MRRTRNLTITLLIFSTISVASASQCSDRLLEKFSANGGRDAWLKTMRSMQNSINEVIQRGGLSDGTKLSEDRLHQIRLNSQAAEKNIIEASACTLPGQPTSPSPSTMGNQSGSAALNPTQRCGSRIDTGTWNWGAWRVVSESPLSVLRDGDTIPSPESTWKNDLFRNINYTINNNAEESERRGAQKIKDWLICLSGRGAAVTASAGATTTQTEQIPNCPPTLPPSFVTWSLYDKQLQWWNLTNNCGREVSVTFRSEGALENTQTFGNGKSYRAKWRGDNPPTQIVWDAAKGLGFYRNKPAGAALKCQSSLPL